MNRPKLSSCKETPEFIREVYKTIADWQRRNWGRMYLCPECVEYRNSSRCTKCGIGNWNLEDVVEVAKSRGVRLISETGLMFT